MFVCFVVLIVGLYIVDVELEVAVCMGLVLFGLVSFRCFDC